MAKPVEFMPPINMREYFSLRKSRETSFRDITLTLRGRDAISLAVSHFGLGLGAKDVVLLPGYLCDTVTGAFASRCRIDYYDIREDFSINPTVIEDRLSKQRVRVLYVIHYFGFLHQNLAQLSKICKEHSVLLFEDHAHSALSRFSYGYADAMIFSFRKVLPVPEGGGVWIRDLPKGIRIERSTWLSDVISLIILTKRKLWHMSKGFRNIISRFIQKDIDALNNGQIEICARPISHMSHRIVQSTDVDNIFSIRREQFRQWQNLLESGRLQPVFSSLPDDVCPQGFPIWVSNPDELVSKLEGFGIFLKIHWRTMPDEVAQKCPTTWRMSRSIVTLPIYPRLSFGEIQRLATFLSAYGKPASGLGGNARSGG